MYGHKAKNGTNDIDQIMCLEQEGVTCTMAFK